MTLFSRFIGLQLALGLLVWLLVSGSGLGMYVDLPSIILVTGVPLGVLLTCFTPKQLREALNTFMQAASGRQADGRSQASLIMDRAYQAIWGAGFVTTLFGLIGMLADLSDPSSIGAGMAVALLPMAYAALLAELVVSPCQQIVKNGVDSQGKPVVDQKIELGPPSNGNAMWKGVTIVSVMIACFLAPIVSFSEIKKENYLSADAEDRLRQHLLGEQEAVANRREDNPLDADE